jgi:hypothetical protein
MTDANVTWQTVPLAGRLRIAYRAGWFDAKLGLPWSREFDTDIDLQSFYEEGRLDRCNVELAGLTVAWDGSASGVADLERAVDQAFLLVGRAVPPGVSR